MSPVRLLAFVAVVLLGGAARAQDGGFYLPPDVPKLNAQLYRQPFDAETTMWANDASMRPTGYVIARASLGYVRDPFVYQWSDGYTQSLLRDAFQLDLAASVNLWRLRLGVDLPIYLLATSDLDDRGQAGLGPVLLDLKGTILDHDRMGFGLALAARTELPTNTTSLPLGRGLGYELEAILDGKVGGFIATFNVGHRGVPRSDLGDDQRWDDALLLRAGLGYRFRDRGGLSFDVASSTVYADLFGRYGTPVEGMLGGWARINRNLVTRLGVGTGFTAAIGSPAVRVVGSFAWEPTLEKPAPEPEPEPPPAPEPAAPPGPGGLRIRTLDVDGNPVAATVIVTHISVPEGVERPPGPLSFQVVAGVGQSSLAAGRVAIVVQGEGYLPVDLEGTIVPDEVTSFTVPMTSRASREGSERIVIHEQVFFDFDKATIRIESWALLKEVAFLVQQYPQIRMVRIEGHTDSRGSDAYNFRLSTDRAQAVLDFLVAQGVEGSRLTSVGYGERRPLDPAETEEAWAKNRRVDFFIEQWDETLAPEGHERMEAPAR